MTKPSMSAALLSNGNYGIDHHRLLEGRFVKYNFQHQLDTVNIEVPFAVSQMHARNHNECGSAR